MRQNLTDLPTDLPRPVDDGKANHLRGMQIPKIKLDSTEGVEVDLVLSGLDRHKVGDNLSQKTVQIEA